MSTVRRERVKELLDQAARLPPAARAGFVQREAQDEPAIAAEALDLLRALDDSRFMNAPTIAADPATTRIDTNAPQSPTICETAGTRIGRYKLLQPIGEGGFGTVFMAEQTEPVNRRVALKIIKAGMDTRQVIARFEAERQALALMDHPNIAKVLNGGATETGRPYFVMELVRGEPITKYCDREQLPIERRLQLFADVCRAVQHAHQKGVIHRDLKPSNVLVTVADGEPLPKVIDFGIAKATATRLTDKTLFTEMQQLIGTPEYMSPEQADTSSADIDTRSDVYSLGVLLYELLTGTTPFDGKRLKSAGFKGLIRIIREEEPPRPSVRASEFLKRTPGAAKERSSDAATKGSSAWHSLSSSLRGSVASSLPRTLRGDLDWIVMRCLEKDRRRRYETANSLATDVQRYLSGEPVLAAPPSKLYHARKFLRRYRTAAVIATAIVATASIGAVAALMQWQQAETARAAESHQRARAQAVSEFLKDLLTAADPARAKGAKLTVREALDAAAKRIDEKPPTGQPLVEADIRYTIGDTYLSLGLFAEAAAQLRAADALQTSVLGNEHADTLRTRSKLAWVLTEQTDYAGAAGIARPTMEAQIRTLGPDHPDTLLSAGLLGNALGFVNQYAEGEALMLSVIERRLRVQGQDHPESARAMNTLGGLYLHNTYPEKAEPLHREAWRINKQAHGDEHPETLNSVYFVASALDELNRLAEAEALFRSILEPGLRVWGPDHVYIPQIRGDIAATMEKQGRVKEAEAMYRDVIADLKRLAGPADFATITIKRWLADNLAAQRRHADAEPILREALDAARQKYGLDHAGTSIRMTTQLAALLVTLGKDAEAEQLAREAIGYQQRQAPRPNLHELRRSYGALVTVLLRRGAKEDAMHAERELHHSLLSQVEATGADQGIVVITANALLFPKNIELLDAPRGLEFSERANEAAKGRDLSVLRTLARAYVLNEYWEEAIDVWEQIVAILPDDVARARTLNAAAWYLLTAQPATAQDPSAALRLAVRANELSDRADPAILDTLALAQHRAGDSAAAMETQKRALQLLSPDDPDRKEYESRLDEYECDSRPN
ncbi:MAG: protein kinase domain-containing protein [Phycisphaerae bacterium]